MGRVLNPLVVDGQVHGGVAQGIGQALMEQVLFDPESGQLLTASFMDYAMPRAADLPMFETRFNEVLTASKPLRGKRGRRGRDRCSNSRGHERSQRRAGVRR